jgi:hypothetical protein
MDRKESMGDIWGGRNLHCFDGAIQTLFRCERPDTCQTLSAEDLQLTLTAQKLEAFEAGDVGGGGAATVLKGFEENAECPTPNS